MILSQVTLVCLAALVFGEGKYNSDSILKDCGYECTVNCLCPCSQATGECTEGCVDGYYGYNCTKKCDPHCWGNICQQHNGHCACVLGYLYRNSRCEADKGKECKSLQGCQHNKCASTGDEECIDGCKPGRFGYSCDSHCEDNCFCDQESGTCTDCVQGWFGPECQSMCSRGCTEGCYRNGSCFNGCTPGTFGETCESKCSSDCVSRCDKLTGECIECKERRYGPNCQDDCSAGCAGCDREGQCTKGCVKGYYGDKCKLKCPQHCNGGSCDQNGTCIKSTCPSECDGGSCDLDGKCTACKTGFYGPRCSKICEGCVLGDCHKDTGECQNEETKDVNFFWVAGGVTLFIIGAAFIVYVLYRLKRMNGRIYYSARWGRRRSTFGDNQRDVAGLRLVPVPSHPVEELDNASPLVCTIRGRTPTSYVEPAPSGGNKVILEQHGDRDLEQQGARDSAQQGACDSEQQGARDSEQQGAPDSEQQGARDSARQGARDSEQQGAAASPEALQQSEGLLDEAAALPASGGSSERPVSYFYPNYCELNEDLITSLPQHPRRPQTAGLSSSSIMSGRTSGDSDNGNATGGNINIPLIAESFWKPNTDDSPPDRDCRPDDENYDHPFRDGYC